MFQNSLKWQGKKLQDKIDQPVSNLEHEAEIPIDIVEFLVDLMLTHRQVLLDLFVRESKRFAAEVSSQLARLEKFDVSLDLYFCRWPLVFCWTLRCSRYVLCDLKTFVLIQPS